MMTNGKIGVALVGGYLLGRTRKAKMAIGLGMFVAGKKLNLNPQQLVKMLADSPVISGLGDQVRKDVVEGTKSALTSAVTQRANSFADSLHERTLDLNDPARLVSGSDDEAADADADDSDVEDGPEEDERADGGRERDEERPRPRRKTTSGDGRPAKAARSAKSTKSAEPAAGASGSGTSSSGKGSAGKASSARASSGRAASNGRSHGAGSARKTAGGARKTAAKSASGSARKTANTANRGGGNG